MNNKKELDKIELGERVRKRREDMNLTREELSERLDISPHFLAYIEYGKKGMSLFTLKRMCEILYVSSDFLIFGREKEDIRKDLQETLACVDESDLPYVEANMNNFLQLLVKLKSNKEFVE